MKEQEKSMSLLNLTLWLGGVFYFGWMISQIILNLLTISISSKGFFYSEDPGFIMNTIASILTFFNDDGNYGLVQLIKYLPFGLIVYKCTKTKFATLISALMTIFSIFLVSITADMATQLDNAWEYLMTYKEDMIDYFTNQVIWLLPILIGYVFVELVKLLTPTLLKVEFIQNIVNKILEGVKWIKDFWMDKTTRLFEKPQNQIVEKIKSETKDIKVKKDTKSIKSEKKNEKELTKSKPSKKKLKKKSKKK